jgi:hypothetical protein
MKRICLTALCLIPLTMSLNACGSKDKGEDSGSELSAYIGSEDLRAMYYWGRIYVRSSYELKDTKISVGGKQVGVGSFTWSSGQLPAYYTGSISPVSGLTVDVVTTIKASGKPKQLKLVFANGSRGMELRVRQDAQPTTPSVTPPSSEPTTPSVTPPASQPANPPVSNLPTGDIDTKFRAKNGMESRYRMFIPKDYAGSKRGMLVYLHGDMHLELAGSYFMEKMKTLGERYNLIPVAVYSPSSSARWWDGGSRNAEVLHQLLTKLKADYGMNSDRVYFYSMSGGSLFNSAYFIPMYGEFYKGASAFMCGGARSDMESGKLGKIVRNFKMLFYTHPTDFLYSSAVESYKMYRSMGADAQFENPLLGGHCVLDPNGKMDELLSKWSN